MSLQEVSAAVVLQILRAVAPDSAAALEAQLPPSSAALHGLNVPMKHVVADDAQQPVIVQMVEHALAARSRKERRAAQVQQTLTDKTAAVGLLVMPVLPPLVAPSSGGASARPTITALPAPPAPTAPILTILEDFDDEEGGVETPPVSVVSAGHGGPSSSSSVRAAGCAAARLLLSSCGVRSSDLAPDSLARMRLLLFGHGSALGGPDLDQVAVRKFGPEWLGQGFGFSPRPGLQYMLVQSKGGPCGPLAVVNAEVCRWLYFGCAAVMGRAGCAADAVRAAGGDADAESDAWAVEGSRRGACWEPVEGGGGEGEGKPLDPSPTDQHRALVLAIVTIVWRCRPEGSRTRPAYLVCPRDGYAAGSGLPPPLSLRVDGYPVLLPTDGVTDKLVLHTCETLVGLAAAVEASCDVLFSPAGPGLVCVLLSAILTRGGGAVLPGDGTTRHAQAGVLADVDAATLPSIAASGLIGAYAYASQEVVNLLLSGRACSNVFDGTKVLHNDSGGGEQQDSVTLHGVPSRCDVGFLSALAPLGLLQVGARVTRPRAPVWVCFGESHYSFLLVPHRGCVWPQTGGGAHPKYTFGRKRTGPSYLPSSVERCVGLGALALVGGGGAEGGGQQHLDVVYADGLAGQDELIRVTVTTRVQVKGPPPSYSDVELSALELWLCGAFPGCAVSWNDVEPWEAMRLDSKAMQGRR